MERHGSETYFVVGEGLLGESVGGREPRLAATAAAPAFRFSRMGPKGTRRQLGEANLRKIANAMTGGGGSPSRNPAGYTYLGQFVDHDITFDPASSLQKQNDPDALVDFRTPAFDLDCVYGRGRDDQPYIYDAEGLFLLGDPIQGGNDANARDLPRNHAEPARALIGDPRNDENALVSQLHGLFLRFHNRMVRDNASLPFEKVQEKVRFHHQYILLNDFLPRIVHPCVLDQLKSDGKYDGGKIKFFHWKNFPFMPAEFSVAAYRLGHSMVRPGYRLNDNVLLPIFPVPSQGFPEGLTGFRAVNPAWALDWGRFIDTDIRSIGGTEESDKKRLQFAYRLDTSLVNPLGDLPPAVAANPSSLPLRNLLRGWRLGLPSGQAVARAIGVTPLADEEILIGKAVDEPGPSDLKPIVEISDVFRDNCPLWTYILAEAAHHKVSVKVPVQEDRSINTPKLGPVGGRIVAEVFLGLMFGDNTSVLTRDPNWTPPQGTDYTLKNFVLYALGA